VQEGIDDPNSHSGGTIMMCVIDKDGARMVTQDKPQAAR
jgi:hypothetical protein